MLSIVFHVPQWGNATLLEILWTLIGLGILAVTVPNYFSIRKDLRVPAALSEKREQLAAKVIVEGHIRREMLRILKGMTIVTIGLISMWVPNEPHHATTIGGVDVITTVGFFTIGILIAVQSYLDKVGRNVVHELLEETS